MGFIYAVSPLLPNTQPFSWGSRSRPAKGGDEEDSQGTCSAWGEFILVLLLLWESGGSMGLGWVLSSGFHTLRPKPLPLDHSHCLADLSHFHFMYKYRNHLNLFLVVPHMVSSVYFLL